MSLFKSKGQFVMSDVDFEHLEEVLIILGKEG